ncbi:MAG TPA: iron-containing alcohol dehydrogenase [Planctomycetota bacterium]|nr:iron-containing alcohol dehydrogenase [Planctomycetota bacterium]HRR80713.1 iron-containing alcohol dehydrogenase [Planctomycetota bacterium]HRT95939.1 iron-containing alcohol dehydrogenase [Planctomycetota bacterium]
MPSFTTAREIVTGIGSVGCVGQRAARLGTRALVVTGRSAMRTSGATDRVLASLREAGVEATVFDQVEHDPDVTTVDAGRGACFEGQCEVVIGLGGGSALDAAKAIAALVHEREPTADFVLGRAIAQPGLPFIAIPTTSGTGAEVTKNAVLSDRARRLKQSIRAECMMPAVAIVDPELTLSCPPRVTAAAGMDALVQAIESFTSIHATPLTDALAFEAARRLIGWLAAAWADGSNLAAREQCAYGSLMAGMALANARLGAVHGMAHPLGARYGLEHGVVCALLMPHVMRLNRAHVGDKYDRLSSLAEDDIVAFVERLIERFGLRRALDGVTIPREDFAAIAAESLPSGSLKANPRKFTEGDVAAVLEALVR